MLEIPKLLKGQKALITGGSSGIGKGCAFSLAEAGADVAINYRKSPEDAQAVADHCKTFGVEAIIVKADVSQEDQVVAMFEETKKAFGTVDILINNAGLQADSPFTEMSLEKWNRVIGINLTGQFLCAREAAKEFLRRGVVPEVSCSAGKIICMSSVHEIVPWAGHANYAASKGGIHLMMQSISQELAGKKVRVNSIGPGAIRTPINTSAWDTPEALNDLMKLIPYDRIGEPDDIGRAAVWLASDQSEYVNGITLFVDGGMTLYPGFRTGG